MMKMKKLFLLFTLALLGQWAIAQNKIDYSVYDDKFNIYVANDLGRNGYYDQKPIAELMGEMAEEVGPEFVIAAGDVHHFEGVRSVNDPLWMTNYELIYSHPELMIDWFPICGNHEYRGNTQAVLDYARVSRRWTMPARYYTKAFNEEGTTVRIVWIDTTPLIDKYRQENDKYPDACLQTLTTSCNGWMVFGCSQRRLGDCSRSPSDLCRDAERRNRTSEHAAACRPHSAPSSCRYVCMWSHPQLPACACQWQRHRLCD